MQRILSRADEATRRRRGERFFEGLEARQRLGQGRHDRGEAFAFAGAELSEGDHYGLARHFPACLKAISVLHKILEPGECWDVTTSGADWGIDAREDTYVLINIGTLTLKPGARIIVHGNIFSLVCQRVIKSANAGSQPSHFDLGIFATPYSGELYFPPFDGAHGTSGLSGCPGIDGEADQVGGSILGPRVSLREAHNKDGTDGESGQDGENGRRGLNGGACKLTEITLREIHPGSEPLVIFSQAGQGGSGGMGG